MMTSFSSKAVARQLDRPVAMSGQQRFQAPLTLFPQAFSVLLLSRPMRRE
jgi:hypothetical protein